MEGIPAVPDHNEIINRRKFKRRAGQRMDDSAFALTRSRTAHSPDIDATLAMANGILQGPQGNTILLKALSLLLDQPSH
jgi:hypothetical protein